MADSLTKTFYTAGGRPVKDGGGIEPDVEVKADSLPSITYYLAGVRDSAEVLNDYVVDYIARHPTIAPAADFELSDADYEDFKQRVLASSFKYDAMSDKTLENLEKVARFEGYYEEAKPEFEALKAKLSHNLAKDLRRNKQQLMEILAKEILPSYYYQAGTIEYGLKHDKTFDEAVKLLGDSDRYRKILHP